MNAHTPRTVALAALSLVLLSHAALAQGIGGGDPLVAETTQIVRIVLLITKSLAVVFIVGGCAMLATGRWAIAGLAGMAFGVIGMAKADQIAAWLAT